MNSVLALNSTKLELTMNVSEMEMQETIHNEVLNCLLKSKGGPCGQIVQEYYSEHSVLKRGITLL